MWYKAPNGRLINLNLITSIDKGTGTDKMNYIVFYMQFNDRLDQPRYIKIDFANANSRDSEYNKILRSLTLNKVGVIV